MGDTVTATKAFHEVIEPHVNRVSLIDTFNDEKIEALNVAEALGDSLYAIRLDTPASRRGDFSKIMEEVRWELDIRGYGHVKILLSGGLDEYQIMAYNEFADAYGVGTAVSNAPVVDFSMDIIEIEGKPLAKRGKRSGSKSVYRCPDCFDTSVLPFGTSPGQCRCGGKKEELLEALLSEGPKMFPLPGPEEIRSFVIQQIEKVNL
jgi:nicotinate phosphoribosyltransferase